jgi:hypothetical protein
MVRLERFLTGLLTSHQDPNNAKSCTGTRSGTWSGGFADTTTAAPSPRSSSYPHVNAPTRPSLS